MIHFWIIRWDYWLWFKIINTKFAEINKNMNPTWNTSWNMVFFFFFFVCWCGCRPKSDWGWRWGTRTITWTLLPQVNNCVFVTLKKITKFLNTSVFFVSFSNTTHEAKGQCRDSVQKLGAIRCNILVQNLGVKSRCKILVQKLGAKAWC